MQQTPKIQSVDDSVFAKMQESLRQSKAISEELIEFNVLQNQDSFDTLRMKEASIASELDFNQENASVTFDSEEKDSIDLN